MKKINLFLYFLVIAVFTIGSYLHFQKEWVYYRFAENAFLDRNYLKAQKYYLLSLETGMPVEKIVNRLAITSQQQNKEIEIISFFQEKIRKESNKESSIYDLARYYLELHEWDKAISLFQYLPLQEKQYLFPLTQALMGEKRYTEACHYLNTYLEKHPKDEIRLLHAKELILAGNKEKALSEYALYLQNFPDDVLAQIEEVNLLLSMQEYGQAFYKLKNIPIKKIDYPSLRILGDLYLFFGWEEKGKEILLKLKEKGFAAPLLNSILLGNKESLVADLSQKRLYPANESLIFQIADTYFSLEENQKGLEVLFYLLHTHKDNERYILDRIGDSYRFFLNDLAKAEKYYKKALALDPSFAPIQVKLGFVLSQREKFRSAYTFLLKGAKKYPKDLNIALELANIDLEQGREELGKQRLDKILKLLPNYAPALFLLANYEAKSGHMFTEKKDYFPALDSNIYDLHYAYLLQYWGDFYKAEKIYRNYLKLLEKEEVQFSLAWLLASTDRFEEATAIYKQLLKKEKNVKRALLFLAKTKMMEKKLDQALVFIDQALAYEKSNGDILATKAEILYLDKEYEKSIETYQKLLSQKKYRSKAYIGMGKNYLKLQQKNLADQAFSTALGLDPKDVDALFYSAYPDKILSKHFVGSLIDSSLSSKEKTVLADAYANLGHNPQAISLYASALEIDPDFFLAHLKLGQILARDKQYSKAEKIFSALLKNFPDDYLLLLWKARLYSWSRDFDKSLAIYGTLREEMPSDPQIIREMARTFEWNKQIFQAMRIYSEGTTPSVNRQLRAKLLLSNLPKEWVFPKIKSNKNYRTPTDLYDTASSDINSLSPKDQNILLPLLSDLREQYLTQKSLYLEQEAALLFWEQKYAHALPYLKKLILLNPQNMEAQFDLAQADCQLGLCNQSHAIYQKIIEDAPSHNLSQKALAKNEIQDNLFTHLIADHWSETGRGEIDQMRRWRTYFRWDLPVTCRHHLYADGLYWHERPSFETPSQIANQSILNTRYDSFGYVVGYRGVFSPYVSGDAELSQKFYENGAFASKTMGHLQLNFRCYESFQLKMAFDRINDMGNYFALKQGIQYNQCSAEVDTLIQSRLEMIAHGRLQIYKDNNTLQHHDFESSLILHTFPQILKIGFRGEYRDSRRLNYLLYNTEGMLYNIAHPYWTPDHYFGGRAILKWRHDISKEHFCEANKNVYDITISSGSDTELNPFYSLEASWDYQITDHLSFNVRGMVHKSKVWDADELWLKIQYQF